MKKIFPALLICICTIAISSRISERIMWQYTTIPARVDVAESSSLVEIKRRLHQLIQEVPEERIYVHSDKPLYQPGETIWFTAYIREGSTLKPSAASDIISFELVSPKGTVEKTMKMVARDGKASGDFPLPAELPGGQYKLRAFTKWQSNEQQYKPFEKTLTVQEVILPQVKMLLDFEKSSFGAGDMVIASLKAENNRNEPIRQQEIKYYYMINGQKKGNAVTRTGKDGDAFIRFELPDDLKSTDVVLVASTEYEGQAESISRSVPVTLNDVALDFFPEGGDLVPGLPSVVAFRAVNENKKGCEVKGVVVNRKGDKVASFSTYHNGMGSFTLTPAAGEEYRVKLLEPVGVKQTFRLPAPVQNGITMKVDSVTDKGIAVTLHSSSKRSINIIAQERGKVIHSATLALNAGKTVHTVSTDKGTMGITQITVFDSLFTGLAERLVFIHPQKQMNIKVTADKDKYLPREKVKVTVQTVDEKGNPVPADVSLSVVNDQLLAFADDKSGNILTSMLLEQDINTAIDDPSFYLNRKEKKQKQALDLLMMTSGWRRFTWKSLAGNDLPKAKVAAEKAIVSGTITDGETGKAVRGASIEIGAKTVQADSSGRFTLGFIEPDFPVAITISAKGYETAYHNIYDYTSSLPVHLFRKGYNMRSAMDDLPSRLDRLVPGSLSKRAAVPEAAMAMAPAAERKPQQPVREKNDGPRDQRAMALKKANVQNNYSSGLYYRTREFPLPDYKADTAVTERTDFRTTIFWNGNITTGKDGKAEVSFYLNDDVTSFKMSAEGFSSTGLAGAGDSKMYSQLPFAVNTKVPLAVTGDDMIMIPVVLKNNTTKPVGGAVSVSLPSSLQLDGKFNGGRTLMPGATEVVMIPCKVLNQPGTYRLSLSFESCGLSDVISKQIIVRSKGFPAEQSFSGREKDATFTSEIRNLVPGTIRARFTAYPSVVNDLMTGIEGILREPSGCFEQTSMSSYPNTMVLDYIKSTNQQDPALATRAAALLDRGYSRLTTFETKEKGFEWFGAAPGHEALTAYGLMQFADMKRVGGKVDNNMMERTQKWLLSRRDGKGGFLRNTKALDSFGRGSDVITNAYIVHALSEAGCTEIKKELEAAYQQSSALADPYINALLVTALYNQKEADKANRLLSALMKEQQPDGSFKGASHSITYSTGNALNIETTSLAMLAMLKAREHGQEVNEGALTKAAGFLVSSRSGYGTFGNTQGTVLALKALSGYAKSRPSKNGSGSIEIFINGKKAAEKAFTGAEKENIEITGLEEFLSEGKNNIRVKIKSDAEAPAYSIAVDYSTTLPESSSQCPLVLTSAPAATKLKTGEVLRLNVNCKNKNHTALPSPMVIVGIPGGFTLQHWQLKEMQERRVFDYYEINGNNLVLYFRSFNPGEEKKLALDLKAEIPGTYEAPACTAYLYYTNEHKSWCGYDKITITDAVKN